MHIGNEMPSKIIKFKDQSLQVIIRDEADESVMREIFKFREYRIAEDVIEETADPILDIGAHAGFFAMYTRLLNEKVKIYAVEPEKNNLAQLKKHLEMNNITGVEIVPGVLASETGEANLRISKDSHNHEVVEQEMGEGEYQKVKSYSLLDLLKKIKVKKVGLIKMDIEGGEFSIIESWDKDEFTLVKNVILEYHNRRKDDYKQIENKFRENGFSVRVFPSQFDKTMGFIFAHNKRLK